PDIDGLETGRLIRQYKKSAHTPIIFITAYADEMQTAQGYSLGAVDYILSPVRPDVLRSKVKVFVELYQMQQRTRAMAQAEVARQAAEEANRRADLLAHPRPEPRPVRLPWVTPHASRRTGWCSRSWWRARPSRSTTRAFIRPCSARSRARARPRRSCRTRTGARTSSSPCCRTSCAIRSRRSATPWSS